MAAPAFDPSAKCKRVKPTSSMQQCMETYGIDGVGEWVNNSVSREAEFWSCGMVSRKPDSPKHDHDPEELARCQRLANEAAGTMGSTWRILRSGSDPDTQPFFIAAQRRAAIPKQVDEAMIRTALGGTLHADARVVVEPFAEGTKWWQEIDEDAKGMATDQADFDRVVKPWRDLIAWFPANGLSHPSFVQVTDSVDVSRTLGCVYPCFVVGITDKGSLVGIATHVVE